MLDNTYHPTAESTCFNGKNSKYSYYLHERISTEFFQLLSGHQAFQVEPKAIMAAFKWLNNILRSQEGLDGAWVSYFHEEIKDQFATYAKGSYTIFVDAVEALGLVTVDRFYQPSINTPFLKQNGHCRRYSITEHGKRLLTSSNRQYFKKMFHDPAVKRKIQKQACENKRNHSHYSDPFLESQRDLLMNLNLVEPTWDGFVGSNHDLNLFIDIKTKLHSKLERNDADGRLWNPVVAMSKTHRTSLQYKNLSYVAEIDQRACHPTFLGLLLTQYFLGILTTVHYEGGILDNEVARWLQFTTSKEDFRFSLAQQFGWTKERVKEKLNIWINGGHVPVLDEWFAREYPALNRLLLAVPDRKQLGCLISKHYETRIFQDFELYRLAESLGLKLTYQYDGIGVFSERKEIGPELKKLVDHLTETARRLFNVQLRLKVETLV